MGGLRWPLGHRRDVEDRRFDPPARRDVADAVDGRRMTRCARCKGGKVPTPIRVTVLTVFTIPKSHVVALSCPDCQTPLSYTSARRLNHALVTVVEYE